MPGSMATTSPAMSGLARGEPEPRGFVHLETDAVAEAEVEPVRQPLPGRSSALRRVTGTLDDPRRDVVKRSAGDPGTRGGTRRFQRLADDIAQRGHLVRHVACDEASSHVRPAAAPLVAGPQVDDDRQIGGKRPGAGIMPAAGQRGHHHDVRGRRRARRRARRADLRPDRLSRQRLAVAEQPAALAIGAANERLGGRHASLSRALRTADASQLRRVLDTAACLHRSGVDFDANARVAQSVGDRDRQIARNDRIPEAPPSHGGDRRLELGLIARHAVLHELVEPKLVEQKQLRVGEQLRDALGLWPGNARGPAQTSQPRRGRPPSRPKR
jgi:hypothetical protein